MFYAVESLFFDGSQNTSVLDKHGRAIVSGVLQLIGIFVYLVQSSAKTQTKHNFPCARNALCKIVTEAVEDLCQQSATATTQLGLPLIGNVAIAEVT